MAYLNESSRRSLPSGTVTFLFTDIQGSTPIARQFPEAMPALLERHNAILQESIHAHGGLVFQIIGDAFCAAFSTAGEALQAAVEAQRRLQHEAWDPAPIAVRMGLHTGEAEAAVGEDGSVGYYGYLSLARVQAVMSSAHGEQVLLSSPCAGLVRDRLPEGVSLRDLGEHRVKEGVAPERLWQVAAGDLRLEFPPLTTLDILPNNLPVQINSFVGRERELAQTKDLLEGARMLTLIGPGGTGKTRLALQLAGEALPDFPDGIWLVELAPLADPALVLPTVAATLGLREIPGTPLIDLVTGNLQGKRLLLVLDNCEHLVESCADLVDSLMHACPGLKVLASSREALGIAGETVFRVPPLSLPGLDQAGLEAIGLSEAVRLFVERAAAVKTGFSLTPHNALAVGQICRRLDGIPLALELAAARVAMLSPEQISKRLDDRFRLLTGGSRTALPRQQTLRSLIDWSYDLLSDSERRLFRELSVFVGGWSLEAAEAVCPNLDVLNLLAQLVHKSLVAADDGSTQRDGEEAETRFRLLETVRQYARDRMLETGSVELVRDRHLAYFLAFAEAGERHFYGPLRLQWTDRCELEHDNFRAALQWGLDHDAEAALRLAGALVTFWNTRGFSLEGRRWIQAALDQPSPSNEPGSQAAHRHLSARAKGLSGLSLATLGDGDYKTGVEAGKEAALLYRVLEDRSGLGMMLSTIGYMEALQGKLPEAEQTLAEAVRLARETGDKVVLAYALGVQSRGIFIPRGDLAAARAGAEESARLSREIGVLWASGQSELVLAHIDASLGQWDEAREWVHKAAEVFRELRDPLVLNLAYLELADIELLAGNLAEARRLHMDCIVTLQKIGLRSYLAHELESFAIMARAEGHPRRAARLLGAAEAIAEGIGAGVGGMERLVAEYERTLSWLHDQLDPDAFDACWSEGCAMTSDEAVAYAIEPVSVKG